MYQTRKYSDKILVKKILMYHLTVINLKKQSLAYYLSCIENTLQISVTFDA